MGQSAENIVRISSFERSCLESGTSTVTRLPQVAVQTHKGTYSIFPNLLEQCLLQEYCMGQSAENIVRISSFERSCLESGTSMGRNADVTASTRDWWSEV